MTTNHNQSESACTQIIPLSKIAIGMFLNQIIALEPDLRAALTDRQSDMSLCLQQRLQAAVAGLRHLGGLDRALKEMATTDAECGMACRDYSALGRVFAAQLERSSDVPMPAESRERWKAIFKLLADAHQSPARVA